MMGRITNLLWEQWEIGKICDPAHREVLVVYIDWLRGVNVLNKIKGLMDFQERMLMKEKVQENG